MASSLVIVESPAKARTINRYLGKDYVVKSSVGHVRDLPVSGDGSATAKSGGKREKLSPEEKAVRARSTLIKRMGVDPENGWIADYRVLPDKQKVIKELRAAAAKADRVYLATDLDREGEAIAWHLREVIGGDDSRFARVTFSEITKRAIQEAFARPGELNMDRVHAQHARRYLDRVVGFMVSPLLWKKVARGLSAGRVQSVATRLVVEREREIHAFVPEEFWQVFAHLRRSAEPGGKTFKAEVVKHRGGKPALGNEEQARAAVAELQAAAYRVDKVETKQVKSRPYAPFITSTLQQAASVRLGFGVSRTMRLAQGLYEAGFITYMRTDSTALSADAVRACREHIGAAYGDAYLPEKPNVYTSGKSAQEAHEAIRPSDVGRTAGDLAAAGSSITADHRKLYDLIWRQFVACQMPPAIHDTTAADIAAGDWGLRARGRVLRFDGWQKVLPPARRKGEEDPELPPLENGDALDLLRLDPSQHFTKPPPRFTEASLVKELEKRGIGRPSTYAATIATIQDRGYVRMENKRLYAEKMGEIVTDRLVESFKDLLDYGFTASMEGNLDRVASGEADWKRELDRFYADFKATLERAEADNGGMRANEPTPTDIPCPTCGRTMMIRTAKTGVFLGCSGYSLPPKERCTTTMNLVPGEEAVAAEENGDGETRALQALRRCDSCGTAMDSYLIDEERKLHVCGNNPDCPGFAIERGRYKIKGYDGPVLECDKCGSQMQLKSGRFGKFFGCTNATCKNTRKLLRNGQPAPPKADPVPMPELPCEKSDGHFVLRDGAAGIFLASSNYPRSKETRNPQVTDLRRHRDELDPKHRYLADAPVADPDGNPAVIRFSRKSRSQYVATEVDGKATGWSATWDGNRWVEHRAGKTRKAKAG